MEIEIQITKERIAETLSAPTKPCGAFVEFRGVVRGEENSEKILALEYEAYSPMAEKEIRRILQPLAEKFPCLAARIIHRIGIIPVGETAIYVGIISKHRAEAFSLLAEFMNQLKQDVPIWKVRALPVKTEDGSQKSEVRSPSKNLAIKTLDEAVLEISLRSQTLPPVRAPLIECSGRILREDVFAPEDLPPCDKSTRDGFAIFKNDSSEIFQVVDTLHAAGWKPRELKRGEAVRVATGASLPCENLRVLMQENVARDGDTIKILGADKSENVRRRGEETNAGDLLLRAGTRMDAGVLALLATAGCTAPLASPRLRVLHFTTGDEIIPPGQTPQPGQIRDSNSILIRALLEKSGCDVIQKHLPENFESAMEVVAQLGLTGRPLTPALSPGGGEKESRARRTFNLQPSTFNLLLVSGGASVGEKDFTRALLAELGFEIVFDRVNLRPGAPLIFGVDGSRVAFGLPGNPLSHFVCFHFAVAAAVAKMTGSSAPKFLSGFLTAKLDEPSCPRETLWPAKLAMQNGRLELSPLAWSSSGDIVSLAATGALVRVPANQDALAAGAYVEFLSVHF